MTPAPDSAEAAKALEFMIALKAYAPIPGTGHSASGGYAWAVNGYYKKQKKAMQFAYWATSKDVQIDLAPARATLSRASVITVPGLNAKYPHLAVLGESAKRAQPPMKIVPFQCFFSLDAISATCLP